MEKVRQGTPLSANDDYELLKDLIHSQSNGLASIKMAMLSEENFKILINDSEFMEIVNAYILSPDSRKYSRLYQKWAEISKKNNFNFVKAKANRFIAAFTTDVSTTADEGKFNDVYAWFERHGFFKDATLTDNENWFTRNQRLISVLRREVVDDGNGEVDIYWLNMFVWFLWERLIDNPYRLKKQIIKYGPPGTGKTFTASRDAAREIAIWKSEFNITQGFSTEDLCQTIQFHPTFGYEDFIEGLRPTKHEEQLPNAAQKIITYPLTLHNGVFKEFCKKAGKWEIDLYKAGLMPDRSTKEGREAASPVDLPISNLKTSREKLAGYGEYWNYIFDLIDKSGDRPLREVLPPYFLIIDEINRAELSRVFGELMYCLEYRGCDGKVATQYSELNDESNAMLMTPAGARFFIPSNVYIIGTMNTIDRSVESFDFALRRRFHWQHVIQDETVARVYLTSDKCPNKHGWT